LEEFVGNEEAVGKLTSTVQKNGRALVYGPPGVGKTELTYLVAKVLGLVVVEYNASDERRKEDLELIVRRSRQMTIFGRGILILMDEADSVANWAGVNELLDKSIYPVVLTANEDQKIPKNIRDKCIKIRLYRPRLGDVVKRVRQVFGNGVDFSNVTQDVRQALGRVQFGGDTYETKDDFTIMEEFFKDGETKNLREGHVPWIIDNAVENYAGYDLFKFYQLLEVADMCGDMRIMRLKALGKKPNLKYPQYLRRVMVRGGGEE